jgi:tetrapyrrole methylase family protein/MazG family protein
VLTIIGLGPGDGTEIAPSSLSALRAADGRLFLRTAQHPAVSWLRQNGIRFEAMDHHYETAGTFEDVYDAITRDVLLAARSADAAYAVPGHPLVGEETVRRILQAAAEQNIPVRLAAGRSFLEPALEALGVVVGDALQIVDALSIERIRPRADQDLLVYQMYDAATASRVKIALMRDYPEETEVQVVSAAGTPQACITVMPLHRLDRAACDHLTSAFLAAVPSNRRPPRFDDLVAVMDRLRDPGGCPWDMEQDHRSLRRYLIEECFEAVEAIDHNDPDALCEELGDVLLQVVFHARLGSETGVFSIDDVIERIVHKLIRRHPHVFGTVAVADTDEVLRNWEDIKRSEKGEGWRTGILDGVPQGLPALMRAMEISRRAVKVGFEWAGFQDVLAKVDEELAELKEALAAGSQDAVRKELGDLLFTMVQVARWQKIDPEEALREMLGRFCVRFRNIEAGAAEQGRRVQDLSLEEMEALWQAAKAGAGA